MSWTALQNVFKFWAYANGTLMHIFTNWSEQKSFFWTGVLGSTGVEWIHGLKWIIFLKKSFDRVNVYIFWCLIAHLKGDGMYIDDIYVNIFHFQYNSKKTIDEKNKNRRFKKIQISTYWYFEIWAFSGHVSIWVCLTNPFQKQKNHFIFQVINQSLKWGGMDIGLIKGFE